MSMLVGKYNYNSISMYVLEGADLNFIYFSRFWGIILVTIFVVAVFLKEVLS